MTVYHINIFFSDEDGGYIADGPDLDACSAFGDTPEEALSEVEKRRLRGFQRRRRWESRSLHLVTVP